MNIRKFAPGLMRSDGAYELIEVTSIDDERASNVNSLSEGDGLEDDEQEEWDDYYDY